MNVHAVNSPVYDRAIKQALVPQLLLGLLAALMLDFGVSARVVGVAILASWLSIALVIIRRPSQPTDGDLVLVRSGFWPMLLFAVLVQCFA